jgi:N-acetylmuramic acid 6-phosphate etherase
VRQVTTARSIQPQPPLPPTELENPAGADLDRLAARDVVRLMAREERRSPAAVEAAAGAVARVAELAAAALRGGGRLVFCGAGTSGRLGGLEAAECPPTFGSEPWQVQAIVAGGEAALARAVEGAEDREGEGEAAVAKRGVGPRDVLVAVAASGRTPFVRAALREARRRGARTAFVTCDPALATDEREAADVVVALDVGPEVLTGSTRLKAGTATKVALNAITTAAFASLGKVYGNLMVDLRATNAKLRARAERIVRRLVPQAGEDGAARLLAAAGGDVKVAVLMGRRGLTPGEAGAALAQAGGCLRRALDAAGGSYGQSAAFDAPESPGNAREMGP